MTQSVCFIIDTLSELNLKKDTSLAFMLEAQARGFEVYAVYQQDIFLNNDIDQNSKPQVFGLLKRMKLEKNAQLIQWQVEAEQVQNLNTMRFIFIRQDPPVDENYLNTTYLMDILQLQGVSVVNNPTSVRNCNEKLFAYQFPQCLVPSVVSTQKTIFHEFLDQWQDIIVKPLNGMGGQGIFRVKAGDQNLDSIVETLSAAGQIQIMAQRYIPEIVEGDKRILLINGKPIDYALARVPQKDALRGNLAAGGQGVGLPLTQRDRWLCEQIGPTLVEKGLIFVGLDVIGQYVTEINVTSPTCVRELDALFDLNISGVLFDQLEYIKTLTEDH